MTALAIPDEASAMPETGDEQRFLTAVLDSVTGRDLAEARAIAMRLARFEAGAA